MPWRDSLIIIALGLATLGACIPVLSAEFVNFDDPDYVTNNTVMHGGFSAEALRFALTTNITANWHPLTMLSHLLDCELFGLNAAGHHGTSLLLHAINAALVFVLLRMLTGAVWRSAMVAGLFALHPLHVESVAWISERKDVLSTLMGLSAVIAYVRFVRTRRPGLYAAMIALFVLSLLAKPMFVTLPCLLLLLDFWPLRRLQIPAAGSASTPDSEPHLRTPQRSRVILEKLPLLALSAVFSVITVIVQRHGGAVRDLESVPLGARLSNALVSYALYIAQTFWPVDLAIPYPYPPGGAWPVRLVVIAAMIIISVTIAAIVFMRRAPFVAVGWLWFLGMLVPVIGLVQVSSQSRGDRYTYIPLTGLFIVIVWGAERAAHWLPLRVRAFALGGSAVAALAALGILTFRQTQHWRNAVTLFEHTLAVTQRNAIAHSQLGSAYGEQRRFAEAAEQFAQAVALRPNSPSAHLNFGLAFFDQGRHTEAVERLRQAIKLKPAYADAFNHLGRAQAALRQTDEARRAYEQAVALKPEYAEAHNNLGALLGEAGQFDAAIAQFALALKFKPDYPEAQRNLERARQAQARSGVTRP